MCFMVSFDLPDALTTKRCEQRPDGCALQSVKEPSTVSASKVHTLSTVTCQLLLDTTHDSLLCLPCSTGSTMAAGKLSGRHSCVKRPPRTFTDWLTNTYTNTHKHTYAPTHMYTHAHTCTHSTHAAIHITPTCMTGMIFRCEYN